MRRTFGVALAAAGFYLAGCGSSSPSAPTPPPTSTQTVTGISLSATEFIRLSSPLRLVITATLSDGSTRVVQGTWQSSDQAVATVATDGLVTGVASGEVTISAQHEAHRAERRLRIVPDYAGNWVGAYLIPSCLDGGDWEGACEGEDPAVEFALEMTFSQAGSEVTGLIAVFDEGAIGVTGAIANDGRLAAGGKVDLETAEGPLSIEIMQWNSTAIDSNRSMTGTFDIVFTARDLAGELRYHCTLTDMAKLLSAPARIEPARRLFVRPRRRG